MTTQTNIPTGFYPAPGWEAVLASCAAARGLSVRSKRCVEDRHIVVKLNTNLRGDELKRSMGLFMREAREALHQARLATDASITSSDLVDRLDVVESETARIGERVADLEHLPNDLADLVSRADFMERTVTVVRNRVQALQKENEARLSDHDYVLDDVLGPVVQAELDKQFDAWDKKLLKGIVKWVWKQSGGEIVGDQIDLKLGGPKP